MTETSKRELPDIVRAAASAKIDAEVQPVADQFTRLRALFDAYEAVARKAAENKVHTAIMAALGHTAPHESIDEFAPVRDSLREALLAVGSMLDDREAPKLTGTKVEPSHRGSPVVPAARMEQAPAVKTQVHRKASLDDIETSKRLLAEIEVLRNGVKDQPHARLLPLLQAIVAEVRGVLERLPSDHFYSECLSQTIPILGALKSEGGITAFIQGLAFHAEGDWAHITSTNRRKVMQFDKDVAEKESKPKIAPAVAKANGQTFVHPALPKLRALTDPIMIAGGMVIPEKFESIRERFGLEVQWHEIDHNNPRAAETLVTRIRGGKIGAIVCIEGFMKHSTFKPIITACALSRIPIVMGGKGGIAALGNAFDKLEKKL